MAKRYKCGKCKRLGHNRATCKNKAKKKAKKKITKKKAKKKITKKKAKKKTTKKKVRKKRTIKKSKAKTKKKSGKRRPATQKTWSSLKKRKVMRFVGSTKKGNLSAKDWGIGVTADGLGVATWWGKIWGAKTLKPNRFGTKAAARNHYDKKVREKLNKGYQKISGRKKRHRKRSRRR